MACKRARATRGVKSSCTFISRRWTRVLRAYRASFEGGDGFKEQIGPICSALGRSYARGKVGSCLSIYVAAGHGPPVRGRTQGLLKFKCFYNGEYSAHARHKPPPPKPSGLEDNHKAKKRDRHVTFCTLWLQTWKSQTDKNARNHTSTLA